jgi:hypothetical protein
LITEAGYQEQATAYENMAQAEQKAASTDKLSAFGYSPPPVWRG